MTQPVPDPMKVTEVAAKSGGTGGGAAADAGLGRAEAGASGRAEPIALLRAEAPELTPLPDAACDPLSRVTLSTDVTCGTTMIAAMTAASAPADTAAWRNLRRRARRLISSNVPGGGGGRSIRSCSQLFSSSPRPSIALPHG